MMYGTRGFIVAGFILALSGIAQAQTGFGGPAVKTTVYPESDAAHPGAEHRIVIQASMDRAWHVNAHKPLEDFLIPTTLTLQEIEGVTEASVVYPEAKTLTLSFSPEPMAVYEAEFALGLKLALDESLAPGAYELQARLRYQACNDTQCAPPKTLDIAIPLKVAAPDQPLTPLHSAIIKGIAWGEAAASATTAPAKPEAAAAESGDWRAVAENFTVAGRFSGLEKAAFLAFLDAAESGSDAKGQGLQGKSWWLVLLLVLGGGLLLNLTPCVLPMIPINIAIIGAGARAGSKSRGFALGATYGLGIAMVYGALGLVVVLGVSTAFGTINATPWFNAAIAVIFIVLGLAMFDIVPIDFSRYQAKIGIRKNENGSFIIALLMGAISALLAGACVAPVVIYTVIYAQDRYSQGNPLALALPFLLGAGMALPWPFAGAGLSFLPKPGAWMTRVKQLFGLFIIAFALYYGHLAWTLYADRAPSESAQAGDWHTSLEAGLTEAQQSGQPVLIDFWATWCKNCLVMDKTVLKDPEVIQRLEGYVKIKYQAEDLNHSPVKEVVEHYEVFGLPTFIVLKP